MVSNDQGCRVVKRAQDATARRRRAFVDPRAADLGQLALASILVQKVASADTLGASLAKSLTRHEPALTGIDLISVGEVPAYHPFNQRPAA